MVCREIPSESGNAWAHFGQAIGSAASRMMRRSFGLRLMARRHYAARFSIGRTANLSPAASSTAVKLRNSGFPDCDNIR